MNAETPEPCSEGSIPIGTDAWHQFFAMAKDLAQKAEARRREKQQVPLRIERYQAEAQRADSETPGGLDRAA